MKLKKSFIVLALLFIAPFVLAFPTEFFDEPIDQWLGDSWFNETIIQPATTNATYCCSFSLNAIAHRVTIQVYDYQDGDPEHEKTFWFTNSGTTPNWVLGQSSHRHVCRIQVWHLAQPVQSAGVWSVVMTSPD